MTEETIKQVVVRHYGLGEPANWGEDCIEILRRQNRLWNRLVEIEQGHHEQYFALSSSTPEIQALDAQRDALGEQRDALRKERALLRQGSEPGKPDTGLLEERIRGLTREIKALNAELKTKRKAWRQEIKPELKTLDEARYDAVKQARNASGLWWPNYNTVCASYERARAAAIKHGAQLRFHSFDGGGRFANQIQGGMSVEQLFHGTHSQVRAKPVDAGAFDPQVFRGERKRLRRTELTICIANPAEGRRYLTFPFFYHRPIPADARIKEVLVTRRRLGARVRYAVTFTCTRQVPVSALPFNPSPHACGLNVGWRSTPQGLRVATLSATDRERPQFMTLPPIIIDRLVYAEQLRGQIDTRLHAIHQWFKQRRVDAKPPEAIAKSWEIVRRAPKIGAPKLLRLIYWWQRECPDFQPAILAELEQWRRRHKRNHEHWINLLDKTRARREEFYRLTARDIAQRYSVIALDDFDLSQAARRQAPENSAEDLPQGARHQRVFAAVHLLRRWIEIEAIKLGSELIRIKEHTTQTCHQCGYKVRMTKREELHQACDQCGAVWDQDVNAALNLVAHATG